MRAPQSIRSHAKALTWLAGPIVLTQLGTMLLGAVDILMLGRLGVDELDAAALGNLLLFGALVFGMGVLMGLDPIISQAFGAANQRRLGVALQQGIVVACIISLPLIFALLGTEWVLTKTGQSPALASAAQNYVRVQLFSIAPFLIFCALRGYLQGRRIVQPALWVMLIANIFNVGANWALIWGHWGVPALGLVGAGTASGLSRCVLFIGMAIWIWGFRLHRDAWVSWSREALAWTGIREIIRVGTPAGIQYSLEVWACQIATLLAGTLGVIELAAHAIVFNLVSLSFMMPLGISMAVMTSVGNLLGAKHFDDAVRSAWVGIGLGAGVMLLSAIAFVGLRYTLPSLYTSNVGVIAIAATILPIAATFQLFDGVQAVGAGVLRAMGSTLPAAAFNFVGYYLLALPIGIWLMLVRGWGLAGIWWGLCLGVAIVAVCLVTWIAFRGPSRQRTIGGV